MKPPGGLIDAPVLLAVTVLVTLFTVSPMLVSVTAGVTDNFTEGLASGLTTRWIVAVWSQYGSTVWRSIVLALACTAVALGVGVPCAWALARSASRAARLFEDMLTLPVAVPGLASALALILAYGELRGFRQSYFFILAGHVVFTLPFMVRIVSAAFARGDLQSLDEAARSLGAGFLRRFLGVLVPAVSPSIVAGSLMVFTLSVGEFNLTWMLHTPLTRTLPVGLADSYASMRIEIGSAYTLVFFIVILPMLWGMQALARWIEKTHGSTSGPGR